MMVKIYGFLMLMTLASLISSTMRERTLGECSFVLWGISSNTFGFSLSSMKQCLFFFFFCRCDPFDRVMFKSWILEGSCPAIHPMLVFYKKLIERGFKVFLLTGRHEEQLGSITALNLLLQGYVGHERLILR